MRTYFQKKNFVFLFIFLADLEHSDQVKPFLETMNLLAYQISAKKEALLDQLLLILFESETKITPNSICLWYAKIPADISARSG